MNFEAGSVMLNASTVEAVAEKCEQKVVEVIWSIE